jgi:hypothetical protein
VKTRAASADDDVDAADDAAARAKTLMRSRSTPRARGDMGGGDGGGEEDGEDAFDGARFVVVPPRSRAPDTARISDRYAEAASARDASTPRASGRMDDDEASVVVVTRREWRRDARVDDARDVERRARASDDAHREEIFIVGGSKKRARARTYDYNKDDDERTNERTNESGATTRACDASTPVWVTPWTL